MIHLGTFLRAFFFVTLLASPTGVQAQSPKPAKESRSPSIRPIVVIVSLNSCCASESWPDAEEKIRQEFLQGGIEVVTINGVAATETERRAELIRAADEFHAAAAIRIVKPESTLSKAGVDLWITDRVTQKTVYRFLPLNDVGSGESSTVAGLKTMELFKGSLQEIHVAEQSPPKLPKQIEQISDAPERRRALRKPFRFGGGFSGIFFARDVGGRGAPMVMFGYSPVDGLLFQLEGWFGMMGRDVKEGGNATSLTVNCAVLKPMWEVHKTKTMRPAFGAFLGAAFVFVEGKSNGIAPEYADRLVSPIFGVSAQFSFAVTDSFWLTPVFDIGVFTKRAAVVFGDEDDEIVAQFGVPVLNGGLLVDVHF